MFPMSWERGSYAHGNSGVRNPMMVPVSLALFPIRVGSIVDQRYSVFSTEYTHYSPSISLPSVSTLNDKSLSRQMDKLVVAKNIPS